MLAKQKHFCLLACYIDQDAFVECMVWGLQALKVIVEDDVFLLETTVIFKMVFYKHYLFYRFSGMA